MVLHRVRWCRCTYVLSLACALREKLDVGGKQTENGKTTVVSGENGVPPTPERNYNGCCSANNRSAQADSSGVSKLPGIKRKEL